MDKKAVFYDSIAKDFDSCMNKYDVTKRLEVIYGEFLKEDISNKKLLDAGCGTGLFSKVACERNANVISMDIGKNLLKEVKKKCNSRGLAGSILEIPFKNNTFDYIVSSDVIEHTTNPLREYW